MLFGKVEGGEVHRVAIHARRSTHITRGDGMQLAATRDWVRCHWVWIRA